MVIYQTNPAPSCSIAPKSLWLSTKSVKQYMNKDMQCLNFIINNNLNYACKIRKSHQLMGSKTRNIVKYNRKITMSSWVTDLGHISAAVSTLPTHRCTKVTTSHCTKVTESIFQKILWLPFSLPRLGAHELLGQPGSTTLETYRSRMIINIFQCRQAIIYGLVGHSEMKLFI